MTQRVVAKRKSRYRTMNITSPWEEDIPSLSSNFQIQLSNQFGLFLWCDSCAVKLKSIKFSSMIFVSLSLAIFINLSTFLYWFNFAWYYFLFDICSHAFLFMKDKKCSEQKDLSIIGSKSLSDYVTKNIQCIFFYLNINFVQVYHIW